MMRRDERQRSNEDLGLSDLKGRTPDVAQLAAWEDEAVLRLRRAGLLSGPSGRSSWSVWGAVAAAALLVVFWGGFATGRYSAPAWAGDRPAAGLEEASLDLQLAAVRYADSLAQLTRLAGKAESGTASAERLRSAQEVALSALYSAAYETVRLTPDDPVATRILQGFQSREPRKDDPETNRKVAWY